MQRKKRILVSTEFSGLNTGYACIASNLLKAFHESGKYEVFEHARYCRASDPYHQQLLRNTPWKVFPNLPEGDHEENIYRSHPSNEFGRWKWDYICLETQPDIVCFSKDTPVTTITGTKNIADIQPGDLVLTHKGRYKKVVNKFITKYGKSLLNLNIRCNNHELKVTPNHPFLTVGKDVNAATRWVDAENLTKGDLLCLPIQKEDSEFICQDEVARVIGYYAAEGCLMKKKVKYGGYETGVQFTFNKLEQKYITEIIQTVIENFPYRTITTKNVKNSCVLRIFSDEFASFINSVVKGHSKSKVLTEKVFLSSKSIQKQILTGLFRGDGGSSKGRYYYYTSSRELAYQVYNICLRFNMIPAMSYSKNTLKNKSFYRYVFSFGGTSKANFLEILDGNYNIVPHERINDNYAFVNIKNIGQGEIEEYVYNIEVEEDNSYVAVTCCHNCSYDDFWMSSFIDQSPFRRFYKTVMMPTVDAINQNEQWLDLYIRTDHILTYTKFGYDVLENEGGGLIPLRGVATPAVDTNTYRFSGNRRSHKEAFGLDPDSIIIGMVARNQRRKLFPDFGEAFAEFVRKANFEHTKNVYLYWHTSVPDVGWNLPKYIKDSGLSHKVIMTYFCHNPQCQKWFPSFYQDATTLCKFCGQRSAHLSNSSVGVDNKALACIYNFMDLYVQFITNEGLGIPCLEAAACGSPIAATNYSGTEDLIRNLNGKGLSPRTLFHEAETSRQLSLPSIDELVEYIDEFTRLPESVRHNMSVKTAKLAVEHYGGWSNVAQRWMDVFDSIDIPPQNPWATSPQIINTNGIRPPSPQEMNDEQFINWCLGSILQRPDWLNSYAGLTMLRDLSWGRTVTNNLGFFFGELSQLSVKPSYEVCNRNTIMKMVVDQRNNFNQAEQMRANYLQNGRIRP